MVSGSIRTTIYFPRDLHRKYKIYCINKGLSVSNSLVQFIKKELEQDSDKPVVEYATKLFDEHGIK